MNIKNLLTSLFIALSFASYGQLDCGCPIDIDPVCAQDSTGNYVLMPNECLAECWGFTVVADSLCNAGGPDCICTQEFAPVCVMDSLGNIFQAPNACYAACWGVTVLPDSLCNTGGPNCICTQEYAPVCATDSLGNYYQAPNACYAECWGLTIVTDSTLCDNPFTDCECEVTDPQAFVCAQDSLGNVFPVPNACFAECWGLTVVEGDCEITPWEGCDCPIDENEPFVCAVDSLGHPCYVPNACFAECWGLTIVGDSLCEVIDIEPEIDIEIMNCLDSLELNENTTFQQALLLISENCGLELPQCIVDAPIFDTDSAFFMYIFANCDDFGFNGNTEGSSVMNLYNMVQSNSLTSVKDLNKDVAGFELVNNPVSDCIQYKLNIKNASNPIVRLMDVNGAVVSTDVLQLSAGNHIITKDVSTLKSGMYFMSLSNGNAKVITRKVIVIE
jgi:Secretion system C-terminal sorting domain